MIHVRLKEELDRLEIKAAVAARAAGEEDSQGLRDVLGGRKRLSTDLLAALGAATGVDVLYVLTGQRASDNALTPAERDLLGRYRAAPSALQDAALRVLSGTGQAAFQQSVSGSIGQQIQVQGNNATLGGVTMGSRRKK